MKAVLLLTAPLALTLAGCMSLSYTPTAANSDACLQRSVGKPNQRVRTGADQPLPDSKCESMRTTWARVTGPQIMNQSEHGSVRNRPH